MPLHSFLTVVPLNFKNMSPFTCSSCRSLSPKGSFNNSGRIFHFAYTPRFFSKVLLLVYLFEVNGLFIWNANDLWFSWQSNCRALIKQELSQEGIPEVSEGSEGDVQASSCSAFLSPMAWSYPCALLVQSSS